jgi:hypothetical protein
MFAFRASESKRGTVLRKSELSNSVSSSIFPVRNLTERTERDKSDFELLERRQDRVLGLAPPERVLALQRGHWLYRVRTAYRLHAGLRQPEVPDLAFLNQLLDGAGDVFDRHVLIDAVLIEEVDRVCPEPLQRAFDCSTDVVGIAVERAGLLEIPAELGRDHDLLANRSQRLTDKLLICERAVDLCGVEERDATFDRGSDQGDHLLSVGRRPVAEAHPHTAEPERGDLQVVSKRSLLHFVSFFVASAGVPGAQSLNQSVG